MTPFGGHFVRLPIDSRCSVRLKPSAYYDRLVDVMEELVKFTLLTRERAEYLVDRYSERKAEGGTAQGEAHVAAALGGITPETIRADGRVHHIEMREADAAKDARVGSTVEPTSR